ncbi:SDR family NAD(P)-dependent oxidoreductase [Shewanella jiangmenensis]|nr:SDR family NAD(P)-dependent oxidoreductase [Shewanella jiangmenensis]
MLSTLGIEAYLLDLDTDDAASPALLDADVLVINLPPGLRRGDSGYLERLSRLIVAMKTAPKRLIFISTTGVYPDLVQTMTESDACVHSPVAAVLLGAETLFAGLNTTVVRFAGLVGPGRHPGRFFAGKTCVGGANMPVNLVHLADCIAAVQLLISAPDVEAVYNLCAPIHPDKKTFYTEAARLAGLPLPDFVADDLADSAADAQDNKGGKTIDGSLICRVHGFEYRYCDPMALLQDAHAFK